MTVPSKSQFLVKILELPGIVFTNLSGGNITRGTKVVQRGGGLKSIVKGPSSVEPITIERPFDPITDSLLLATMNSVLTQLDRTYTVTQTQVTAGGIPTGTPVTFIGCVISDINQAEADAESGDEGRIKITLQPQYKRA